ncbi:MAG: hypothetical protein KC635_02810, partial [Myxococcales bacterium]|nr:hypothetical protein [Myxococcales bacterium]
DGGERLVDVVKIGMVMIYFRADERTFGRAVPDAKAPGRWTWRAATDEREARQIAALFETFDKRLRTGFFTLPSALEGAR